jgi:hypothetical protein
VSEQLAEPKYECEVTTVELVHREVDEGCGEEVKE